MQTSGFGERLRALRTAAGLTQKELAERAGIHQHSLVKLERGEREPNWTTVLSLAQILGCAPNDFLPAEGEGEESQPEPTPPEEKPKRRRKKGD